MNLSNLQKTISGLLGRSRYAEADRLLLRFIQKIPKDSLLRYLAFQTAIASGGCGSRACLDQLLGLRDKDEFTLHRQFCALMTVGDYGKAFAKAEELISKWSRIGVSEMLNPAGDDREFILGRSGMRAWAAKALKGLDKCPPGVKNTPWHLFFNAVFVDSIDKSAALDLMEGLSLTDARRYGWMYYHLGRLRLFFGRTAEAVGAFDAALKSRPADWLALCIKAECLACLGNHGAASEIFKRAALANPHAVERIKAWEGEVLLWQGRYAEALKTIDGVLRGCPRFAYSWRAIANYKLGNREAALEDLETALDYDPLDLEALVFRAEIARLEKDHLLAGRLIKAVLKENDAHFWARANLSLVKFAQGRRKEGLDNFNKAGLGLKARTPGSLKEGRSAAIAVKTLERWFELARGNRRNELHCLESWSLRAGKAGPHKRRAAAGRAGAEKPPL